MDKDPRKRVIMIGDDCAHVWEQVDQPIDDSHNNLLYECETCKRRLWDYDIKLRDGKGHPR